MLVLSVPMVGQSKFPAPAPQDASTFGLRIPRTMRLLATSTPKQRHTVRVLIYGQSISKQDWWIEVASDLRRRFPDANLVVANRSLGGFDAARLILPIEHDFFPFYPDLVIFHVYGNQEKYEQMIASIRRRTTAECLLQSDHVNWIPIEGETPTEQQLTRKANGDKHSFDWLPKIADKYGCELSEERKPWYDYLHQHKITPRDMQVDGVHLNARGNFLRAELTKRHLVYRPEAPDPGTVRDYVIGKDVHWMGDKLTLDFEGNRVDLLANTDWKRPAHRSEIRIDGKKPSEFPELYAFTRPSDVIGPDWPVVIRIDREKPLVIEDWTLRILSMNADATEFRFSVHGSVTGHDGEGISTARFVSKSGRVVIEPNYWFVKQSFDYSKQLLSVGFVSRWRVIPLHSDFFEPPQIDDPTKEYAITAAQGLTNGKHRLELKALTTDRTRLHTIRIYRPPLP
jgi:lysophospholipase L1-like esterase